MVRYGCLLDGGWLVVASRVVGCARDGENAQ